MGGGGVECQISHNSSCMAVLSLQKPSLRANDMQHTGGQMPQASQGEQQRWSQSLETQSHCSAISRALWKQTHLWELPVWATFLATGAPIAYILHGSILLMSQSSLWNVSAHKHFSYFRINMRNVLEIFVSDVESTPDKLVPANNCARQMMT